MAEPKDVSKKHFYISMVKSFVRATSGMVSVLDMLKAEKNPR